MKRIVRLVALSVLPFAVLAAPDAGVTGRWAAPANAPTQIKLSIAREGDGYSLGQQWVGANSMTMGTEKYVRTGDAARGAFELDPKSKPASSVPRKLTYAVQNNTLTVTVADGAFAGQHRLTREPSNSPAATKAIARVRAAAKKPLVPADLVGTWQTAEDEPVVVALQFQKGSAPDELRVAQQWGSEFGSYMNSNATYRLVEQAGRWTLQVQELPDAHMKANADYRLIGIERDNDTLVVTLDASHSAGSHVLTRQKK